MEATSETGFSAYSRAHAGELPFRMHRVRFPFALIIVTMGAELKAQAPARRILPELRADVVTGDVTTVHARAGVHVNTGTYVRLALIAGGGHAWRDSERGASYGFEMDGRFVLDPLRGSRYGLYGVGGVAATHDPFAGWQHRLVLGGGVELPAHGRAAIALEGAFAGGFRISLATRRLPLGRR